MRASDGGWGGRAAYRNVGPRERQKMKYVLIAEELGNALVYPTVKDDGRGSTGVNGDQTIGSAELGKMFVGYKIKDAADQIRTLVK